MKHCYRITLLMACLIGYLQAKPVSPDNNKECKPYFIEGNLALKDLQEKVKCEQNLTFISPEFNEESSYCAARESFIEGLTSAETNCTGEGEISQTLDAFIQAYPDSKCQHPAQGKWENTGTRMQFADFVETLKKFVKLLNSERHQ